MTKKLTKEEPSICKNCAYVEICMPINSKVGESVSIDYSCDDYEKKLKW